MVDPKMEICCLTLMSFKPCMIFFQRPKKENLMKIVLAELFHVIIMKGYQRF